VSVVMAEAALIAAAGSSPSVHSEPPVGGEKEKKGRLTVKDLEHKIMEVQSNTDRKLEAIMKMLQNHGPSGQRECNETGNAESRVRAPNTFRETDELSLRVSRSERRHVLSDSDDDSDSVSVLSQKSYGSGKDIPFCKYVDKNGNLSEIFDTRKTAVSDDGLLLDKSQLDILSKSWRCEFPSKITAFKDEYRASFPVHEDSVNVLNVPGLDDIVEPMLRKRHSAKSFKSWGKGRQLCSQPLKSIESLGYQGQMAARMGIVGVSYLQQGLASLMNTLKEEEPNIDRSIQTVRDLFEMSSKVLDQCGRTGAFHHMIRRKATIADTGLESLKDISAKVLDLPLSGDGVFGKGLEAKLKDRKEQKDQLSDLVPELFDNKKRKWQPSSTFERPEKRQKVGTTYAPRHSSAPSTSQSSFKGSFQTPGGFKSRTSTERAQPAVPPFRIPRKK